VSIWNLSLFEAAFFMAAMRHSLDPDVDPRAHLFPVNDVFATADGERLTLRHPRRALLAELRRHRPGALPTSALPRSEAARERRCALSPASRGACAAGARKIGSGSWKRTTCRSISASSRAKPRSLSTCGNGKPWSAGIAKFPVWANAGAAGASDRAAEARRALAEILVELGFNDAEIAPW